MPLEIKPREAVWKALLGMAALFLSNACFADSSYSVQFSAVPALVTGTLSPLSLSFDGKLILMRSRSKSYAGIKINDEKLKLDKSRHRGFFTSTGADMLAIVLTRKSGKEESLGRMELPRVLSAEVMGNFVSIHISGKVTAVLIDSKEVPIQNEEVRWPLPTKPEDLTATHTLEMRGDAAHPDRFYNLSVAPREPEKVEGRGLHLVAFELGPVIVTQSEGTAISGDLRWKPTYALSTRFEIGANIGVTFLEKSPSGFFSVYDMEAMFRYFPSSFGVEVGAGAQDWVGYGGFNFAASINVIKKLSIGLRWIDHVYLGYGRLWGPVPANFYRLGVGFTL